MANTATVLAPAPAKKWRPCPRCLPALKDHPKSLLLVSLSDRTQFVIRTNAQKLKTYAICGLGDLEALLYERWTKERRHGG